MQGNRVYSTPPSMYIKQHTHNTEQTTRQYTAVLTQPSIDEFQLELFDRYLGPYKKVPWSLDLKFLSPIIYDKPTKNTILGLLHKVGSLACEQQSKQRPLRHSLYDFRGLIHRRPAFRLTLNLERQGGQQNVFSILLDALGLMPNLRQCTKT